MSSLWQHVCPFGQNGKKTSKCSNTSKKYAGFFILFVAFDHDTGGIEISIILVFFSENYTKILNEINNWKIVPH